MSLTDNVLGNADYWRGYDAGRAAAERRAFQTLAAIVAAAGGEVTVPRTLVMEDYIVERTESTQDDPFGDTVTYRVKQP